jgi:hypothetical protein
MQVYGGISMFKFHFPGISDRGAHRLEKDGSQSSLHNCLCPVQ